MAEISDKEYLQREMARRELARKSYKRYLYYVHGAQWKRTRLSDFLADTVQKFVEDDTGHAYDVLIIKTPPQHGKSLTITDTDIRENKTNNGDGGGICLCYGSINMTGTDAEKCSINNNTSQNDGGGVYVSKNTSFNSIGNSLWSS